MKRTDIIREEERDSGRGFYTIRHGDEQLRFTDGEWDRLMEILPPKVMITEVRPAFALFGTKTLIRWVERPAREGGK